MEEAKLWIFKVRPQSSAAAPPVWDGRLAQALVANEAKVAILDINLDLCRNVMINGEVIRLDGALRMAPR